MAYLTKFDNLNIKIDMYASINLDFMLKIYTESIKWNFTAIKDIQIIDKRVMSGSILVNNTIYREKLVFFHKDNSGDFKNSDGKIVELDCNKTK